MDLRYVESYMRRMWRVITVFAALSLAGAACGGSGGGGGKVLTATGVVGVFSAAAPSPLSVHLDHPFLLLLRDTTTGAIVFAAQVADPAGA